jgi:hypothetical protein
MQSSSSPSETNPFRSQSSSEVFHDVNLSSLREKHTPINNNNINNTRDGQREQIREEEEEEESRDRNHARASVQEYTVEEAIDHVGFGMFQIIFLSITGLSWLCDAMEMMLLSFIGPSARCEWNLTTTEASSLTSFVFLGMGFGAPSFGMLADRRGRLFALRCSTALTMLAGVGSAMSPTFSGLCFARMVVGFGLGGVPVAYNLCAEYLPTKNRGVYLSSLEFFWSFGSMISAILAWTILPKQSWRVLLGVTVSPLILLGLFLIYMPDSPMYLASKGRLDEAERTLRFISRLNRKPLPVGVLKVADQDKKKRDAEFDARLSETDTNTTSEQREMTNLQGNIYTDDEYSLSFLESNAYENATIIGPQIPQNNFKFMVFVLRRRVFVLRPSALNDNFEING